LALPFKEDKLNCI